MPVQMEASEQLIPAGTWSVDLAHSSIEFRVRHLMLASVKGRFTEFAGWLTAEPDGELRVSGAVKAASLDTHEPQRDAHLRSGDFFDVDAYPEITFESTDVEPLGESMFRVVGELSLRGVTRPIELTATMLGTALDPWGSERVGIEARGQLDRTDFGLTWNAARETGGALVGNAVQIEIEVSAIRHATADPGGETR